MNICARKQQNANICSGACGGVAVAALVVGAPFDTYVYMYIYIYIHTYMYIYMHTHIYMCTYVYTYL